MRKRMLALILVLTAVLALTPVSRAEGTWVCPNCGQEGNVGNFCTYCATPRPAAEWTCPHCGRTGNTGNFCPDCATPRPGAEANAANTGSGGSAGTDVNSINTGSSGSGGADTAASAGTGAAVNERLEQIPGETDRVAVIVDRVSATSFITNKKDPNRWIPDNACDGIESTCWQFSAKKGLKGKSWIEMIFEPETVDEVWFKNGFWGVNDKGKDQWVLNARLKEVKIEFLYDGGSGYQDPVTATLKDESRTGWQRVSTGHHERVRQVRVAVISVYKGSSFPNDGCLSEVMPVQIAPAESAMPAGATQAEVVYESRPDITGCGLKMKLATRSGPGTQYAEPGTFFGSNWEKQTVKVMKKSYDGSVWWVKVDFQNGIKNWYRVWSGVKRVDVDLNPLKEERDICQCDIEPTNDTWYGPGGKYARSNVVINRPACGEIYQFENGYVDVKYWYEDDWADGEHRIWLPERVVHNLYYGDNSGET